MIAAGVIDSVADPRSLGCLPNLIGFPAVQTQGLFRINMLAGSNGSHIHSLVNMVGSTVVDHINTGVRHDLPPIIGDLLNTEFLTDSLDIFLLMNANSRYPDMGKSEQSIKVMSADKAHADNGGIPLFHSSSSFPVDSFIILDNPNKNNIPIESFYMIFYEEWPYFLYSDIHGLKKHMENFFISVTFVNILIPIILLFKIYTIKTKRKNPKNGTKLI
jgi:hypothetical protein